MKFYSTPTEKKMAGGRLKVAVTFSSLNFPDHGTRTEVLWKPLSAESLI
jgi:hypothetical protein